jgi:hypothetical protein
MFYRTNFLLWFLVVGRLVVGVVCCGVWGFFRVLGVVREVLKLLISEGVKGRKTGVLGWYGVLHPILLRL